MGGVAIVTPRAGLFPGVAGSGYFSFGFSTVAGDEVVKAPLTASLTFFSS